MKTSGFLLYRLNFVDRIDLFQRPISTEQDFIKVVELAATQEFDVAKQGTRSGYKWALRAVTVGSIEEEDRQFVAVTFSCEVTSRRGPIITADGITQGTSTYSPPPATLVQILIDVKRHILAIESVPSVIQTRAGWKRSLETILSTAAWKLEFTSQIRLDPVVPEEVVMSRLKSFERVTRLRVTLSIPNPDLGPSYQRLYDEMKEGGIRELTEDMRNERGLNLAPETLPQAALDMALNGYKKGKIHISGYRNGQRDDFTLADDVARIEVEQVRDFVEGYAAGQPSSAVKRFAQAIIKKIDEDMAR